MRVQVYRVEQIVRKDMNTAVNANVLITMDHDMINHIINKNQDLKLILEDIGNKRGELKDETFDLSNDAIREIFEKALVNATEEFIVSKL